MRGGERTPHAGILLARNSQVLFHPPRTRLQTGESQGLPAASVVEMLGEADSGTTLPLLITVARMLVATEPRFAPTSAATDGGSSGGQLPALSSSTPRVVYFDLQFKLRIPVLIRILVALLLDQPIESNLPHAGAASSLAATTSKLSPGTVWPRLRSCLHRLEIHRPRSSGELAMLLEQLIAPPKPAANPASSSSHCASASSSSPDVATSASESSPQQQQQQRSQPRLANRPSSIPISLLCFDGFGTSWFYQDRTNQRGLDVASYHLRQQKASLSAASSPSADGTAGTVTPAPSPHAGQAPRPSGRSAQYDIAKAITKLQAKHRCRVIWTRGVLYGQVPKGFDAVSDISLLVDAVSTSTKAALACHVSMHQQLQALKQQPNQQNDGLASINGVGDVIGLSSPSTSVSLATVGAAGGSGAGAARLSVSVSTATDVDTFQALLRDASYLISDLAAKVTHTVVLSRVVDVEDQLGIDSSTHDGSGAGASTGLGSSAGSRGSMVMTNTVTIPSFSPSTSSASSDAIAGVKQLHPDSAAVASSSSVTAASASGSGDPSVVHHNDVEPLVQCLQQLALQRHHGSGATAAATASSVPAVPAAPSKARVCTSAFIARMLRSNVGTGASAAAGASGHQGGGHAVLESVFAVSTCTAALK